MKFCWCTIRVNNLEESIKFYQEIVGLSLSRRFAGGQDVEIAFLNDGGTEVELLYDSEAKLPASVEGISLGFKVDSVDQQIAFIKEKGLSVESGPFEPNPSIKFFYIKDPNGLSIQFVENKT